MRSSSSMLSQFTGEISMSDYTKAVERAVEAAKKMRGFYLRQWSDDEADEKPQSVLDFDCALSAVREQKVRAVEARVVFRDFSGGVVSAEILLPPETPIGDRVTILLHGEPWNADEKLMIHLAGGSQEHDPGCVFECSKCGS